MTEHDAALRGLESLLDFFQKLLAHLEAQLAPPPPPPSFFERVRRIVTGKALAGQYRRAACRVIRFRVSRMTEGLRERVLADLAANAEELASPFVPDERVSRAKPCEDDAWDNCAACPAEMRDVAGALPDQTSSPSANDAGVAVCDSTLAQSLHSARSEEAAPHMQPHELVRASANDERSTCAEWAPPIADTVLPGKAATNAPWHGSIQPRRDRHFASAGFARAQDAPAPFDRLARHRAARNLPTRRARWGEARGPDTPCPRDFVFSHTRAFVR